MNGTARKPRGIVLAQGQRATWIDFEIESNSFYSADTFRVKVLPDATLTAAWWLSQVPLQIEIFAGFPANVDSFDTSDLKSLILGNADTIDYDPVNGEFELHGRDLASLFIDNVLVTDGTFLNHRTEWIVSQLAARRNLTPIITDTDEFAGTTLFNDTVRMRTWRTEWDLLVWMASELGYLAFVRGKNLYFQPPMQDPNPYPLTFTQPTDQLASPKFTGESLRLWRDLNVARGIVVKMYSTGVRSGKSVVASYPKSAASATPGQAGSDTLLYVIRDKPEQSQQQVQQHAEATFQQITQHEMNMEAELPGDVDLTVLRQVKLTGTGSMFDQTYYPRKITRSMSFEGGFDMHVEAKNISAQSAAAA